MTEIIYSTLVESLKRLYSKGKVTLTKLDTMLVENKLKQFEYDYIIE